MPKSHMIVDDGAALVINPCPAVLKYLTMTVKSFITPEIEYTDPDTGEKRTRPGQKTIKYTTEKLYTKIDTPSGVLSVQTMAGFAESLVAETKRSGYELHVFDRRRIDFPAARLELTRDHRYSQEQILTRALEQNKSGLIGAPTRYGKSYLLLNTVRAYPTLRVLVVIPGEDLLLQTVKFLSAHITQREIVQIGGGSRKVYQSEYGITVCSADSLHRIAPSEIDLIVADEPHSLVTAGRMEEWVRFTGIRRIGVGATLEGRFDGKDKLITGLFGPVLAERTYLEAVAEGAICPLVVLFVQLAINPRSCASRTRDTVYNHMFFHNKNMAMLCAKICTDIIPESDQTLVFIKNEKQADLFKKHLKDDGSVIAMAKKLPDKKRKEVFAKMQSGEILRCFATNIYAQGVTFSDLRCMVNCEAGGNNTSAIQKPGRLAERRPDKRYGIVIDFEFVMPDDPMVGDERQNQDKPWFHLIRDSRARKQAYVNKGYIVEDIDSLETLEKKFYEYR